LCRAISSLNSAKDLGWDNFRRPSGVITLSIASARPLCSTLFKGAPQLMEQHAVVISQSIRHCGARRLRTMTAGQRFQIGFALFELSQEPIALLDHRSGLRLGSGKLPLEVVCSTFCPLHAAATPCNVVMADYTISA
jgi:hypothetical protein